MRLLKFAALPIVVAFSLLAPTAFAQNLTSSPTANTVQTTHKKGRQVKFTLQNATGASISVRNGDEQLTLAPGQSQMVKSSAGTRIVTDAGSGQPGTVIVEVSDDMGGSTVNVR